MIAWDETLVMMSNESPGKFNIVIVWEETRWNQFYVVIVWDEIWWNQLYIVMMRNESQWKGNIVMRGTILTILYQVILLQNVHSVQCACVSMN